ncbi:MAG: hypothetical protein Q9212_004431 [Teloschistes hypoglaucus]
MPQRGTPKINARIKEVPQQQPPALKKKPGSSNLGSRETQPAVPGPSGSSKMIAKKDGNLSLRTYYEHPGSAIPPKTRSLLKTEGSLLRGIRKSWSSGSEKPPWPSATKPQKAPGQPEGQLLWDKFEDNESRKRFTSDGTEVEIDTNGLEELKMIGTEQFSEWKLAALLEEIRRHHSLPKRSVVVDMREESHGFVNGEPVSVYGQYNWDNVDVAAFDIPQVEIEKLSTISSNHSGLFDIPQRKTVAKNAQNLAPLPVDPKTARVESEEELLKRLAPDETQYFRFPVSDHARPDDRQVEELVSLMRAILLNEDKTFIVHCHGGMGRTTTVMVMFDMLRNAPQVSRKAIETRQVTLRRKQGSDPTKAENAYKAMHAGERDQLLGEFWLYAYHNSVFAPNPQTWTEWRGSRGG